MAASDPFIALTLLSYSLVEVEYLLKFCLQHSIFCKLERVAEFDIVRLYVNLVIKSEEFDVSVLLLPSFPAHTLADKRIFPVDHQF